MQRWSNFQKTVIVPAFCELRAHNIFATVQKLACCQTCAHGDLSQRYASYIFFHVQDKDHCIETPASQPLKLYLGFDFESVRRPGPRTVNPQEALSRGLERRPR